MIIIVIMYTALIIAFIVAAVKVEATIKQKLRIKRLKKLIK